MASGSQPEDTQPSQEDNKPAQPNDENVMPEGDGPPKKRELIVKEIYGFEEGKKLDFISGMNDYAPGTWRETDREADELAFVVHYKNEQEVEEVPMRVIRQHCPVEAATYLISFMEPIEDQYQDYKDRVAE